MRIPNTIDDLITNLSKVIEKFSKEIYHPGTFVVEGLNNKNLQKYIDGSLYLKDMDEEDQAAIFYLNHINTYRCLRYVEQFSITWMVYLGKTLEDIIKTADRDNISTFLFRNFMEFSAYFIKAADELNKLVPDYHELLIKKDFNYDDAELWKLRKSIEDICYPSKFNVGDLQKIVNDKKTDKEKQEDFVRFMKSKYKGPQSDLLASFRKGMDQIIPNFQRSYDLLCEFIHPGVHVVSTYQTKIPLLKNENNKGSIKFFENGYLSAYGFDFTEDDNFQIFKTLYLPFLVETTTKCAEVVIEKNKEMMWLYKKYLSMVKKNYSKNIFHHLKQCPNSSLSEHICACGSQKLIKECCGKL